MAIFTNLQQLPKFENAVLTIGSFDGVHHGHKKILEQVVREAKKINGESVLITFYPHPRKIIYPGTPLGLLTEPKQKMDLITAVGIDHIVVVPFSREFSLMSAEDYITHFLWKNFHPKVIVLGYDHHFGHSRQGDIKLLRAKLASKVRISEIPPQLIDDAAVSSTKIRKALERGTVEEANDMLERRYSFRGAVVVGDKLGRKLGYPTANLQLKYSDILIPKKGVYIAYAVLNGKHYPSMLSIGIRPTINDKKNLSIEVHLLDFNKNLYGQTLEVELLHYLREEEKCDSLDALIRLMQQDEEKTRRYFNDLIIVN